MEKIFICVDENEIIISIAQERFENFVETEMSVERFMRDYYDIDVTDGKHKYMNGEFVEVSDIPFSSICVERSKNMIRNRRQIECFPVINRGFAWYETLSEAQSTELREWYRAWLNATDTLCAPETPEWIK